MLLASSSVTVVTQSHSLTRSVFFFLGSDLFDVSIKIIEVESKTILILDIFKCRHILRRVTKVYYYSLPLVSI